MEKVLYAVTAGSALARGCARRELADALVAAGAHGVTINVADDAVAPAAGLRISSSGAPAEALVSVWLDSATDHLRAPFDDVVAGVAETSSRTPSPTSRTRRPGRSPRGPRRGTPSSRSASRRRP